MAKRIVFDEAARSQIKKGVDALANAVRVTLGPKGRNVLIEKSYGSPQITKDGVTIAKEIELEDRLQNVGAQIVKEAASRTVDRAGDGTTTAVVLTQAIINDGFKNVTAGADPMQIRTGIEKALVDAVVELKSLSKPVKGKDEIRKVAMISSNNDRQIADLIANVMEKVGREGVVTVEEGQTFGVVEKYVEGMQFDKGYIAAYFVTNTEDLTAEIRDPYIIITDSKISAIKDILPVIEKIAQSGKKDIVIIAEDVEGEALATLIVNKLKGILNIVAVKAPAFGDRRKEMLKDIAVLTGGSVISEELGKKLETTELNDLGKAEKVIVGKEFTTIVNGKGVKKEINARIDSIKNEIEKTESTYDKDKLAERLAKMTGGVAVIQVGAATEVEMKERKDRLDDALQATRAAIEEGVVPGGGTALFNVFESMGILKGDIAKGSEVNIVNGRGQIANFKALNNYTADEMIGWQILKYALLAPLVTIAENAGVEKGGILEKIIYARGIKGKEERNKWGFDARRMEVTDMIAAGIIDPVKVTRLALENAASAATLLLTTQAVIIEAPKQEDDHDHGSSGGGMGGMGDMSGMM